MDEWSRTFRPYKLTVVLAICTLAFGGLALVAWSRVTAPMANDRQDATALAGSELFRAKGCATCHDGPSSSATIRTGPGLAVLAEVASLRQPGLPAREYVRRSITSPSSFLVPGFAEGEMGVMPVLSMSPSEVEAIVEYLMP